MSIISDSYYIDEINLTPQQINVVNQSWQAYHEEVILTKLLGYELYTIYKDDLEDNPTTPESPTAQRFKDLVDGKEFTFEFNGNSITKKWAGLRDLNFYKSLIADYVYYQYRNQTENYNSGAGQVHSNTENSTRADIVPKLINVWNKMIDKYGPTPYWMCDADLFLNNNNYVHYNSMPSAYNFLLANIETYPEWIFEPLDKQNIFGI